MVDWLISVHGSMLGSAQETDISFSRSIILEKKKKKNGEKLSGLFPLYRLTFIFKFKLFENLLGSGAQPFGVQMMSAAKSRDEIKEPDVYGGH